MASAFLSPSASVPAPAIARHSWKLPDGASLRDVVLPVRADEAPHRDVNHGFANALASLSDERETAPYPEHADELRHAARQVARWRR
jgi:ubiquinol oxidase